MVYTSHLLVMILGMDDGVFLGLPHEGFQDFFVPVKHGETHQLAAFAQAQLPPNVVMMEAVSAEEASKGEMKRLFGARTAC
jgi:hypothetical protein